MGSRRGNSGTHARAEVTLRGVRFTDHPRNPAEVRGRVVEWERVGWGSHADGHHGDGRCMRLPRLTTMWGQLEQGVARRARARRWRRLIEDGTLDVTERFEGTRRGAWVRLLVACLLGGGLAIASLTMWRGGWPGTETLPGVAWLEWLVAILMGVMALAYASFFLAPGIGGLRANVKRVRAMGGSVEFERRDGGIERRAWTALRRVRRRGFEQFVTLEFDDDAAFTFPVKRLRPVIEWQAERLRPWPERVAWGAPALVVLLTQAGALLGVWVLSRTPGLPDDFDRVEGYVGLTSMGLMLAAMVWWARWQEAREARRRRPRRVARIADNSARG